MEARGVGNSCRYSGDNVLISLRFANGSEGTISYLANGDRAFSKERIEVFGGGSAAVLEDFRRLELVRNGEEKSSAHDGGRIRDIAQNGPHLLRLYSDGLKHRFHSWS